MSCRPTSTTPGCTVTALSPSYSGVSLQGNIPVLASVTSNKTYCFVASLYCLVCTLSCKTNAPRGPAVSSLFSLVDDLVEVSCANTAALPSSRRRARASQMRPFVLSTHSVALKPALKEVIHKFLFPHLHQRLRSPSPNPLCHPGSSHPAGREGPWLAAIGTHSSIRTGLCHIASLLTGARRKRKELARQEMLQANPVSSLENLSILFFFFHPLF